jgi:putative membrane protein
VEQRSAVWPPVRGRLRRVLLADNIWGVSALILLVTGGMRAFGGYEKGTDYYLHQPLFHLKMTLFVLILLWSSRR